MVTVGYRYCWLPSQLVRSANLTVTVGYSWLPLLLPPSQLVRSANLTCAALSVHDADIIFTQVPIVGTVVGAIAVTLLVPHCYSLLTTCDQFGDRSRSLAAGGQGARQSDGRRRHARRPRRHRQEALPEGVLETYNDGARTHAHAVRTRSHPSSQPAWQCRPVSRSAPSLPCNLPLQLCSRFVSWRSLVLSSRSLAPPVSSDSVLRSSLPAGGVAVGGVLYAGERPATTVGAAAGAGGASRGQTAARPRLKRWTVAGRRDRAAWRGACV